MHISALWSNTNLDDEKNDRPGVISKLEDQYDTLIAHIWNGESADQMSEEDQAAWNSPLMQAGRKSIQSGIQPMVMPGQETIEALPEVDQVG